MGYMIEMLRKMGARPDFAISKMLGDEAFYERLLRSFLSGEQEAHLHEKIRQKDYAGAFAAAHTMKGSAVTLGLDPLSEALSGLIECLRPCYEEGRTVSEGMKEEAEMDLLHVEKVMGELKKGAFPGRIT